VSDLPLPVRFKNFSALGWQVSAWALVSILWSGAIVAQQCYQVTMATPLSGIHDPTWTGNVSTWLEAAKGALALDTDCWSDGNGGCLPLQLAACSPAGVPSAANGVSYCEVVSSGNANFSFNIEDVASQVASCENWVTAAPPPEAQTTTPDSVSEPVNPGTGNVYTTETDIKFAAPSPVAFQRFYNSADATGVDGVAGWRHSYDRSISTIYGTYSTYPGPSCNGQRRQRLVEFDQPGLRRLWLRQIG